MMKYVGEVDTRDEPERSIYSASELTALAFLKDKIQKYSTRQIRDLPTRKRVSKYYIWRNHSLPVCSEGPNLVLPGWG
jgi:hypothetical protein